MFWMRANWFVAVVNCGGLIWGLWLGFPVYMSMFQAGTVLFQIITFIPYIWLNHTDRYEEG